MHNFKFVKDYRDIDTYRRSFNDLTFRTYGFDFEAWYKQGYWSGAYNPYSFIDGGKIIANVSVNKMHLVIDGTDIRAIQLGTVMTDEAYRNRGLSRELMNIIIAEYENSADFIYLFANGSVLNFYPKFGFKKITEYECRTHSSGNADSPISRKLDLDSMQDQEILFHLIENMKPSGRIGCRYNKGLVMFYCSTMYKDCIRYLPLQDIAVVVDEIDGVRHILEIFSEKEFDLDVVVHALAHGQETRIVFGFTPKQCRDDYVFLPKADDNDTLFVLSNRPLNLPKGMFPVLSHT